MWSYRFRSIGHYEGYTLPNFTIPGKVYIIDRQEIDPEGSIDNVLIHFAESLGAVKKTVRQGKTFIEETRLLEQFRLGQKAHPLIAAIKGEQRIGRICHDNRQMLSEKTDFLAVIENLLIHGSPSPFNPFDKLIREPTEGQRCWA